jgi:hypothetical protein
VVGALAAGDAPVTAGAYRPGMTATEFAAYCRAIRLEDSPGGTRSELALPLLHRAVITLSRCVGSQSESAEAAHSIP